MKIKFEGFWIPKHIWEKKGVSIEEKIVLSGNGHCLEMLNDKNELE